jgi:hypothetical protein
MISPSHFLSDQEVEPKTHAWPASANIHRMTDFVLADIVARRGPTAPQPCRMPEHSGKDANRATLRTWPKVVSPDAPKLVSDCFFHALEA